MGKANGVSRGDRNRNARLVRLRAYVPLVNALVAIDLADVKQMVVVTDHDSMGHESIATTNLYLHFLGTSAHRVSRDSRNCPVADMKPAR